MNQKTISTKEEGKTTRKNYNKPQVTRVKLVAKEAVLGICKSIGSCIDLQQPTSVPGS